MRKLMVFSIVAALSAGLAFAEGGVSGKITFDGKAPKAQPVKMSADKKCLEQYKEAFMFSPVVLGAKGELANAFVYVKKGLEGKKFEPPKDPKIVLDQKGCWYHPHVLGVMVGQKLEIHNSDPTMHNVNATPEFNAAMPATVKMLEKTFKKPKVMFKIKCNVHGWMEAYAGILEHPYFAVSESDGTYEIQGLPPGKYTLEAWHEKLGAQTQEVTVGKDGTKADFKFEGSKKKAAAPAEGDEG